MEIELEKSILNELYRYLKPVGYENFKANTQNFEHTNKIVEEQTGTTFQPDMTATRNGSLAIFEIEMGEELKKTKEKFLNKCSMFLQYDVDKNGNFFLVVPIEQFDPVMSIINSNNLEDIGILRLQKKL
mgnify:CR=1 FL=1